MHLLKTALSVGLAVALPACADHPPRSEEPKPVKISIEEARSRLTDRFISLPGVVGTAITECEGRPCLMIMVAEKTEKLAAQLPQTFEGYRVVIRETGEIRARPRPEPDS